MRDLEVVAIMAWHLLNGQQWKADLQRPETIFKTAPQKRLAVRRPWAAVMAFFLGLTSRGETHRPPAYLPSVGPAPLRFLAVSLPSTNIFKLPPIAPPAEVEAAVIPPPPTNSAKAIVTKVSSAPPVQTNEITGLSDIAQPDGVISPQMLLKFFNKSTNGTSTSVIAPMDFRPPSSTPPPSKATYSTGP